MDTDVPQLALVKEEAPEEQSAGVDQQDPEHLHIKEEQEELWTSLEGEHLCLKEETEAVGFPVTAVSIKSEDDEEKPLVSQLHQQQIEDRDVPTSSSAGQMAAETGGGAGTSRNPDLNPHEQTSDSSETEVSGDDEDDDDGVNQDSELSDSGSETGDEDDDWNESRSSESDGIDSASVNGMSRREKKKITISKVTQDIPLSIKKMEPERKRKVSAVWDHFDLLTANKVKCRICSAELSFTNKSTSSLLRHYRVKHENEEEANTPRTATESRNIALDQADLNFIIKDCQPLSIVESEGVRGFLDPSYALPTRQTVKGTMAKKHAEELEQVKRGVQQAVAMPRKTVCQAANVDTCSSSPDNCPKDCNHDLVPDEMSSLQKCLACGGPFAPLKWSGVRCKVCNQPWHKKCFVRKNEKVAEHLLLVCSEQSSNEVISSEEEYVPDSTADSDRSLDDISKPPIISLKRLQNSEASTSKSRSKKKRHYQEDYLEGDRERDSEAAESLTKDGISTGLHERSEVTAKERNPDAVANISARVEDSSDTPSSLKNKTYCYICGKLQTKFTRHLQTHEKTHADVARVLSLPKKSKDRMKMLTKLRNKGNHSHNSEVLASGIGSLKLRRTAKTNYEGRDYIHCMYCQALYLRRDLWRHVRKCSSKPVEANSEVGRKKVLSLASMNESARCQQISPGVWKILTGMKDDEISSTVRSDLSILQLAQFFFNKHGQDPTKYDYIHQRLRECGRLLLMLRKDFSIHTFEDAVRPANFDVVISAVKKVSGYDEEKRCYHTPSLALKLGHSLQKVNDILHCRAQLTQHSTLIKSTQSFKTLFAKKWSELLSHTALTTLNERHFNKPSTLPFTEDVQRLHRHLEKKTELALKEFKEHSSPKSYSELCKATMANVILCNRRRGGEISKMTLNGFQERDTSPLHKDVAFGLTKFELHLCQHFSRVELRGKKGRKVAVLLSPDMVNNITLLMEKREDCGVMAENLFLFARPHCLTPFRGQDCLRLYASECGAENPELLRSTQLRKHVATLSQILNLKNHELDQVANFLGHDIRVHREYYRLPEATTQLAKISKLLIAMEKGSLKSFQGKTLEEIEIEDNLQMMDSSAESEADAESEVDAAVEVDADSEVQGNPSHLQTGSAEMKQTAKPLVEPTAQSKKSKGKESKRKLRKDPEPGRNKTTNKQFVSLENARRAKKNPWSPMEVAAVLRHFNEHIKKGKLATMIECQQCKKAEDPTLAGRSTQHIRDFVRNRGLTLKKKESPG
nr:uncharacterized protein LOC129152259 isoform X2 [Nothobranchius furzeri]XP_054592994.1 uncharacterized protein LOC129152259 isoform X2 [Nothobranchius furzeri]